MRVSPNNANGSQSTVAGRGIAEISTRTESGEELVSELSALHVPDYTKNLLSAKAATANGHSVSFTPTGGCIALKEGCEITPCGEAATLHAGVWPCTEDSVQSECATRVCPPCPCGTADWAILTLETLRAYCKHTVSVCPAARRPRSVRCALWVSLRKPQCQVPFHRSPELPDLSRECSVTSVVPSRPNPWGVVGTSCRL